MSEAGDVYGRAFSMQLQAVIFDFDGVLCHDRFYATLRDTHPCVYDFIQTRVFDKGSDVADRWMRGEISSDDVNRMISSCTGIDLRFLTRVFVEDVKRMRIDRRLIGLAASLRARGIGVGLVTDNMDVFSQVTVPHNRLAEVFSVIVNSSDYRQTKDENGGALFDVAIERIGRGTTIQRSLLIDDSRSTVQAFVARGGEAYLYSTYEEFSAWAEGAGLIRSCQA